MYNKRGKQRKGARLQLGLVSKLLSDIYDEVIPFDDVTKIQSFPVTLVLPYSRYKVSVVLIVPGISSQREILSEKVSGTSFQR